MQIKQDMKKIKILFRTIFSDFKYFISKFDFLQVLNSPFVGLKLRFYFGEIKQGTPYFLPRKWVKSKTKDGYLNPVSIKHFGINIVGLGWKTKWDEYDFRFEWSPMISIVLFGKQFVIWFIPNIGKKPYQESYWECWLAYKYGTKGSIRERLEQLYKIYQCTYTSYTTDNIGNPIKTTHDDMPYIIKQKWLKRTNYESKDAVEQD